VPKTADEALLHRQERRGRCPNKGDAGDVRRRGRYLAMGLLEVGFRRGDRILVLCCDHHALDREVGVLAGASLGAETSAIRPDRWDGDSLRKLVLPDSLLVLACHEGTLAWKKTGIRGKLIGDAPGVMWWRLLESRQRTADPSARPTG
jgi:hypothetical protein